VSEQIAVLLPTPLTGRGPGYTCGVLAREMANHGLGVTIVTPRARGFPVVPAEIIQTLPLWTQFVPYHYVRSKVEPELEAKFVDFATRPGSQVRAAYIFADATLKTILALKRANISVFREQFNCVRGTAKAILDQAYTLFGEIPRHPITDASVVREQELIEAMDYIFCPNAMVEASLLRCHVEPSKLISTSYGWDPARFSGSDKLLPSSDGITVAFVGTICVRKGVHLLLEYWARSNVKGRLILAGDMEPIIKEKCASLLARDDVIVLDYIKNIGALYRSADVFVFPSLEEGGPQVTYEACACALPVITTPMGAGRIVRHNQEGFVIDPYDDIGWISALHALADDISLRRNMSHAAHVRAKEFLWRNVAAHRAQQILERLRSHPTILAS
jgi:glycosyltransferase involved in cell wall biosynthesis